MSHISAEINPLKQKRLTPWLLTIICIFIQSVPASATSDFPRYIFILPYGYIGWIQIIFNDPQAPPLSIKDGGVVIAVPESGVIRTSALRIHSDLAEDEFYYSSQPTNDDPPLRRVPTEYVLPGINHGGFGVMDTEGKGKGYSWFIFVGTPEQRKQTPLADWNAIIANQRKLHGNAKVTVPNPYPTPGRMHPITR